MHTLIELITTHRNYAPWVIFVLTLLAGLNIPISIDLLMIASAVLAATVLPKMAPALYLAILIGSYFSAWISYWVGRKLLIKLVKFPRLRKILPETRLQRIQKFYQKRGYLTLILGRFIPFGMRNGIFMTAGATKMPFKQFIARDGLACSLWATSCFSLYYCLGRNYETLASQVKIINLAIFFGFSVTVIGVLWYKKHKNRVNAKKVNK